jgi:Cu2+-exporting ATPase
LFFSYNGKFAGVIAVADTVKETAKSAVNQLSEMGINTVMITGDNESTAAAIASQVGINNVVSGVLPNEKEGAVRLMSNSGCVAMVATELTTPRTYEG